MSANKKTQCPHDSVSRADYVKDAPFWKCDRCNHEFKPQNAIDELVSDAYDRGYEAGDEYGYETSRESVEW